MAGPIMCSSLSVRESLGLRKVLDPLWCLGTALGKRVCGSSTLRFNKPLRIEGWALERHILLGARIFTIRDSQARILPLSQTMLQRHVLALALLVILGAVAYSNSLSNQFVHDDNYQIVRNPYLHSDESLTRLLFSNVWGYQTPGRAGTSNYYRPLQMLAYRWIAQAYGVNPSPFHWTNLVLHLLVSSTTYLMFWRLTRNYGISLSGAVLFVLHPIHTEAVDWIASLPELGCALFYFLSFGLFLKSRPGYRRRQSHSERKNKSWIHQQTRLREDGSGTLPLFFRSPCHCCSRRWR